jgi:hypothetical protein
MVGFAVALLAVNPVNQTLNQASASHIKNPEQAKVVEVAIATPAPEPVKAPEPTPPVAPAPQPEPTPPPVPTGSCQTEISKYDWSQAVALAVATAESGLDPGTVNYNPSTYDYSVGCFQVNIWGANALTRPSEAELKDAAINVAWAYKIYAANGHSFIGQWGVCRAKVACY